MEYLEEEDDEKAGEELVDILEVVFALGQTHGLGNKALLERMRIKSDLRGAFAERIFLVEVEDS